MLNKLFNKLKNKGEIQMKKEKRLLELKGVKVPDFSEPVGEVFEKKINEAKAKINKLKIKVNQSLAERGKIESEIQNIKHTLIIEEDPFEIAELKRERKVLEEQLQSVEDLSDINIDEYAKGILETKEIKKLYKEAREEYVEKVNQAKEYENELRTLYQSSIKEIYRFIADTGSDSHFRKASVYYNHIKNL